MTGVKKGANRTCVGWEQSNIPKLSISALPAIVEMMVNSDFLTKLHLFVNRLLTTC